MKQSIEAWIFHTEDREILLLKVEDETVSFWQPITGGIESGESPEEACLREIKEETEDIEVLSVDNVLPPLVIADDKRLKFPPSAVINLRFVRSDSGSTAASGRLRSVIFGFGSARNWLATGFEFCHLEPI